MGEDTPFTRAALANAITNPDGSISRPLCCGQKMTDDGGCSEGCCDYFRCEVCGKRLTAEYGD